MRSMDNFKKAIKEMTGIYDMVEAIYCIDCKFSEKCEASYRCVNANAPWGKTEQVLMKPHDFCSYGEEVRKS